MESLLGPVNQFAAAHPHYYAIGWAMGGFFARSFIFTKNNARALVKSYFTRQRKALQKLGRSPAEIKQIMEEEADLILSAAQEAKIEADAEPAAPVPLPDPQKPS